MRDEQRHEAILSSIGCVMKVAPLAVRLAIQQKRLDRQILCLDPALARFRELPLVSGHPTHDYFFGQGLAVRPFNSI